MVNRKDLIHETNDYTYNFRKFQTVGSFAKNVLMVKLLYMMQIKNRIVY